MAYTTRVKNSNLFFLFLCPTKSNSEMLVMLVKEKKQSQYYNFLRCNHSGSGSISNVDIVFMEVKSTNV